MPNIEVLAYSPLNMEQFIDFCVRGQQTSPGVFATDELDREIRGVNSWLHGREVTEAHFFHTPLGHEMSFFMAMVQKHDDEEEERPWFRRLDFSAPRVALEPEIPGLDRHMRFDGQLAILNQVSSLNNLLEAIESDPDLDAQFAAESKKVQDFLQTLEGEPTERRRFLAALRSDRGSEPTQVFKALKFSLED